MRILQVIDTLEIGGAEKIMVMLSNLLHENNIDVSVMLLVSDGVLTNELNSEIPIYRLNRRARFNLETMKSYEAILNEFDIIHVHLKHNFRYTQLVKRLFNIKSGKVVFHNHSHLFSTKKNKIKHLKDVLFKTVFKPRYYIGVSEDICDWAHQYLKIPQHHIYLLSNTIARANVNKSVSTKSGAVIVSNITPIKNLDFALRLVSLLHVNLTIYGAIRDQGYYNQLLKQIDDLNLKDKVSIVTNCHNIQPELCRYDFALHTSLKETGPLVLIEYLAHGLPFLSHATGDVYETLKTELPMFFISSFDVNEWQHKLYGLKKVSKSSIKSIYDKHFSEEVYLKICLDIYQNIKHS